MKGIVCRLGHKNTNATAGRGQGDRRADLPARRAGHRGEDSARGTTASARQEAVNAATRPNLARSRPTATGGDRNKVRAEHEAYIRDPQKPRSDIALVLCRGFGGMNVALIIRAANA